MFVMKKQEVEALGLKKGDIIALKHELFGPTINFVVYRKLGKINYGEKGILDCLYFEGYASGIEFNARRKPEYSFRNGMPITLVSISSIKKLGNIEDICPEEFDTEQQIEQGMQIFG